MAMSNEQIQTGVETLVQKYMTDKFIILYAMLSTCQ
jgi:hypothetical protein